MTTMIKTTLFCLFALLSCLVAHAEKADTMQELHIRAEAQAYDGVKKITIYTGPVHLVKGTMVINADRLEVVEDPKGGKIGTLLASPGKLVTYRQKRDGGPDLWAEGEAEKVVYDDALDLLKLYKNAKMVLLDGKKRTHESSGIYISYDSRSDFMQVHNSLDGSTIPGAGFTNAVIYPVEDKAKVKPAMKVAPKADNQPDSMPVIVDQSGTSHE